MSKTSRRRTPPHARCWSLTARLNVALLPARQCLILAHFGTFPKIQCALPVLIGKIELSVGWSPKAIRFLLNRSAHQPELRRGLQCTGNYQWDRFSKN